MNSIFFLFLFLFPPLAQADILFLDMNNSSKEVAAAQESALKSKRKLIVFPKNSPEAIKALQQAKDEYVALGKNYEATCAEQKSIDCRKLTEEMTKKSAEITAAQTKMELNINELKAFLSDREGKKQPITSIVISGHDGTGTFSGSFGQIGDAELAGLFDQYPLLRENVRSLHLWGCYTTSPGSLMLNWKRHFPNTALISGYEGRAPLNDKPAGWQYLKGVLAAEPALLEITDHKKLKKALRKLPGALLTHAAISVCDSYASNKESYSFAEMSDLCVQLKDQLMKTSSSFDCYYKATKEECADPPTNTSSGPVREFYEILQKSSACSEISNDSIFRTYSRDQAIRLVFSKEVQKNFSRIYQAELADADQLLSELGAPSGLTFSGLEKLSRKDLLKKIQELQNFLQAKMPDATLDPKSLEFGETEAKLHSLAKLHSVLSSTMVNLDNCVPFEWVEPNENTPSSCVDKKQIGLAGVATALADPVKGKSFILQQTAEKLEKQIDEIENSDKPLASMEERIDFLRAKIGVLSVVRTKLRKKITKETPQQKLAEMKLQWAEFVLANKMNKIPSPKEDPEAVRLAREFHKEHVQFRAKSIDKEIKHLIMLLPSLSSDVTEEHKRQLKILELKAKANEQKAKVLRLSESANSDDLKAAAVLRRELGQQLLVIRMAEIEREMAAHNGLLTAPNADTQLTPQHLATLQSEIDKLSKAKSKLQANKEKESETLAEGQLDTIEIGTKYAF
jgi:hypothetical protein